MQEAKLKKAIKVKVGSAAKALDRFEAAWERAERGERATPEHVLTFANLQLLLRTLTPARWTLLERLRAEGPLSVNELARRLQRDYKNVHGDVKRLVELSLIERRKDALVSVAWDVVRAEMRLAA
jgi:predicted transcriptional regulator